MFAITINGIKISDISPDLQCAHDSVWAAVSYLEEIHGKGSKASYLGTRFRNRVYGLTGPKGDFVTLFEVSPL